MESHSHLYDEQGSFEAIAGTSTIHADSLGFPVHQTASFHAISDFQPERLSSTVCSSNDAVVPTVAPAANQNGWAATQSWARHQPLIKKLYLYERKPLAEVMRHMESQHGFRATVKMYKTHIKQWGLDKKNKAPEMRAIVRKNKQRAEQGKGSIIRVRGQLRKFAEVVRYWSRKGKSIDEIVARQTASPTPEAVELFTPVPSPTLTPLDFAIPERLFRCIRNYFDSSFESGTWVRTDSLSLCHSIKGEGHTNLCVDDLLEQCELACGLFSTRLFAEAGRTLIAATTKIEKIVLGEDPLTLVQIFASIVTFHYEKRDEVALSILRQFSALGTMLLGNQHPLSRICEWMNLVHTSNFEELTIRCMESMVDQFERFVGPFHLSTMSSRVILITYAGWEGNAGIQMTEKLLGECEEKLQPYDFRISWVRRCLAIEYFNRSYYVEAKTLTQKDIACSQHFQSTDWEDSLNIYIVAMCQYALGEVESGIATLHKAINSIMSERGPQDGLGRQWLLQLETSYLEQGRWSSATEVRERRENILESIELTDSYFGSLR